MRETDLQLLERYRRDQAEDAFAEVVRRHVDLVYSASLRQVRSNPLAEEVAQLVFADLARQAPRLAADTILSAWLYQVTRRTAIDLVRRESRRQLREQVACHLHAMNDSPPDWQQVEPLLEEAMDALDQNDRTAILLRFFENKTLRAVGQDLGTTEEAARKRVQRALERLRHFFLQRGVTAGAGGMATLLSCHAVQSAPAGLAAAIASGSTVVAGTAVAAATSQIITMTTLQKTLLVATSVLAIGAPLLVHHQSSKALRQRDDQLQAQTAALTELQTENQRLSNLVVRPAATGLLAAEQNELLRLRAEAAQARTERNEAERLRTELNRLRAAQKPPSTAATEAAPASEFPKESWAFAGYANPEDALRSVAWAGFNGNLQTFLQSMTEEEQRRFLNQETGKTDAEKAASIAEEFAQTKAIRILKKQSLSENELVVRLLIEREDGQSETPNMKILRVGEEWKIAGPYKPPGQAGNF